VAIAAVIGVGAASLLAAARAPAPNPIRTSTTALATTGARVTIMPGACPGGGTEFCFKPESVTIAVGTAVVWMNETGIGHTTSSCTASACPGAPANTGANTWSKPIAAGLGSTVSVTFTSAGTYTYYCMIHGYLAMHGKITVTSSVGPKVSKFTPTSGRIGTKVTITGQNLAHASRVTFNGTSAAIISNSATRIVVKVPSGATTGHIAVTTSGGTATSPGVFTVT
jgi:plastocyanin